MVALTIYLQGYRYTSPITIREARRSFVNVFHIGFQHPTSSPPTPLRLQVSCPLSIAHRQATDQGSYMILSNDSYQYQCHMYRRHAAPTVYIWKPCTTSYHSLKSLARVSQLRSVRCFRTVFQGLIQKTTLHLIQGDNFRSTLHVPQADSLPSFNITTSPQYALIQERRRR